MRSRSEATGLESNAEKQVMDKHTSLSGVNDLWWRGRFYDANANAQQTFDGKKQQRKNTCSPPRTHKQRNPFIPQNPPQANTTVKQNRARIMSFRARERKKGRSRN
jgi:hypothetical protein